MFLWGADLLHYVDKTILLKVFFHVPSHSHADHPAISSTQLISYSIPVPCFYMNYNQFMPKEKRGARSIMPHLYELLLTIQLLHCSLLHMRENSRKTIDTLLGNGFLQVHG